MKRLMTAMLCGALATTMAAPAFAQQSYYDRNSQYQNDRGDYDAQMRDYNAAKDQYDRDRAAYDRRYGRGSYDRYYGGFNRQAPAYSGTYRDTNAVAPGYNSSCAQAKSDAKGSRAAGTILGALIGGAIGSNVAAGGHRGDGTALGAVVGGVIGNKVGGDTKAGAYSAACDANGYYYSYDQTSPYREGRDGVPRGAYDRSYYSQRNCRLAPAQTDSGEYRYIRVCPDNNGRYRIAA